MTNFPPAQPISVDVAVTSMDTYRAPEPSWSISGVKCFEDCPRQFAERYEYKTIPYTETEEQRAGNRVDQQLTLRLSGQIALPDELLWAEPYCRSMESMGTLSAQMAIALTKDLKPCDYYDKTGQVWHRQKLDVVVIGGTGAAVFDWKNGNPNYEWPFQLDTYAVGIMSKFEYVEKVTVANVYLKTKKLGAPRAYTRRQDFQRIAADMYARVDNIARARAAQRWPETPSGLCGWCPVVKCQHNRSAERQK